MAKNDPKIGDVVTCKIAVEAYYSNYGGNPSISFTPGTKGTIVAIAPKVRIVDGEGKDRRQEMAIVDFHCPSTNKTQRTSLNFCNIVKVNK